MKKKQISEILKKTSLDLFNQMWDDDTIEKLQNLNEMFGSGLRFCSYRQNLIDIIQKGDELAISAAFTLFEEYYKREGAYDVISDLAEKMNSFDF